MQLCKYSKSIPLIIVALALISCVLICSFMLLRQSSHQLALQRLSTNLGVNTSWGAVDDYMLNTFKPGMSKEEILQEFEKISPYITRPEKGDCETVQFTPGILNMTVYNLRFCYDSSEEQFLKHFTFEND